jgi:hypothetical protein
MAANSFFMRAGASNRRASLPEAGQGPRLGTARERQRSRSRELIPIELNSGTTNATLPQARYSRVLRTGSVLSTALFQLVLLGVPASEAALLNEPVDCHLELTLRHARARNGDADAFIYLDRVMTRNCRGVVSVRFLKIS